MTEETLARPIVSEIRKTCEACPSQWEGETEGGRHLYIRYRWGYLSWEIGNASNGMAIGGSLDGYMQTAEMVKHLKPYLDFQGLG